MIFFRSRKILDLYWPDGRMFNVKEYLFKGVLALNFQLSTFNLRNEIEIEIKWA
jgi:hypothetical protein